MDQQLFDVNARAYLEVGIALGTTARLREALSREIDRRYVLGQDSSHVVLSAFMGWKNRVDLSEERLQLALGFLNPESIDEVLSRDNLKYTAKLPENP